MRFVFQKIADYLDLIRWDKPIGSLLLLWPTLSALWVASDGHPPAFVLFIFLLGTFLMRAAGCAINDFSDRRFDAHVERTKNRQLVTGKVTPKGALIFSASLALLAFILVLFLNTFTIILALIAGILAGIYPLMKRITHFPQFILGLAYSFGILMAFAAIQNQLPIEAFALFFISFLWTVAYDTEYAMMDREDDLKIGVKSTAIFLGAYEVMTIALLQAIIVVGLILYGIYLDFNFWYFAAVIACGMLFVLQILWIQTRETYLCQRAFLNNNWAWLFVFLGIFFSYL
jgi:4-hydroxybenzoate polyprenyltransferase